MECRLASQELKQAVWPFLCQPEPFTQHPHNLSVTGTHSNAELGLYQKARLDLTGMRAAYILALVLIARPTPAEHR